jgi:hypothetical protein
MMFVSVGDIPFHTFSQICNIELRFPDNLISEAAQVKLPPPLHLSKYGLFLSVHDIVFLCSVHGRNSPAKLKYLGRSIVGP